MYGIFGYMYPKNDPNLGKYTSTMEHMGMTSSLTSYDGGFYCRLRRSNFNEFANQ